MRSIFVRASLLFFLTLPAMSQTTPWSEAMVAALRAQNHAETKRLMDTRSSGGNLAGDFVEVVKGRNTQSQGRFSQNALDRIFAEPLRSAFRDAAFGAFRDKWADPTTPSEAATVLLRVAWNEKGRLTAAHQDSLFQNLLGMLDAPAIPPATRMWILKKLGSHPLLADDRAFLPFLRSPDSLLRSAAYQGLGQKILANRFSGRSADNRRIFENVRERAGESPDLDAIQTIAMFSEEYARAYLLPRCRGNAASIRAVFYRDDGLEHRGLILEAVRLMGMPGQEQAMAKALRHGVKHPEKVIEGLLHGNAEEAEAGNRLKTLFPDAVSGISMNPTHLK